MRTCLSATYHYTKLIRNEMVWRALRLGVVVVTASVPRT